MSFSFRRQRKPSYRQSIILKTNKDPSQIQLLPQVSKRRLPVRRKPKLSVPSLNYLSPTRRSNRLLQGSITTKSSSVRRPTLSSYNKQKSSPKEVLSSSLDLNHIYTPSQILDSFKQCLSKYQQEQIKKYEKIYFFGAQASKICQMDPIRNWGFDDQAGNYKVVQKDHIAYRFQVLTLIGRGSFGQVCKCIDHKTTEIVAVKILRNKKKYHAQGAVEAKVVQYLNEHDPQDKQNIIRMKFAFNFRHHLWLVFELLGVNLYEFLEMNNFQGLSPQLVKRFCTQILVALKHNKTHSVVHGDLKPQNILLKQTNSSEIKLIDYGSSCFEKQRIYSYIQSRFYRAPEIVLGIPYTPSIDMWSFGCIAVELITGEPLFPADSESDLVGRMIEYIGVPPIHMIESSSRSKRFFQPENNPKLLCNTKGKVRFPNSKSLQKLLANTHEDFRDFIEKILVWDPCRRLSPQDALNHQWVLQRSQSKPNRRFIRHRKTQSFLKDEYFQQGGH